MNSKAVSRIVIALLLIGILPFTFNIRQVKAEPKTIHVDDDNNRGPWDGTIEHPYQNITSGLEHASAGDTIFVYNGTYYENLVVNKKVALFGEHKNTTVIVGVAFSPVWESVISVRANDVKIANFTVTNGGHGVYLGASRSVVTDCVAYENGFGLTIGSSSQNLLRRNLLFNNSHNLFVLGFWSINDFKQDIDTSNLVNGKPVYYLVNEDNLSINPVSFPNIGYLGVINSTNVRIANLSLSRNGDGSLIAFSQNTLIENVEATYNYHGISLTCSPGTIVRHCNFSYNSCGILSYYSDNVNIKENYISHNKEGIYLIQSDNVKISHNNFIKNYQYYQAAVAESYNCHWDEGYPSGGNYWSDYGGVDLYSGPHQNETGSDGIGDDPYFIGETDQDNYPLMNPWSPDTTPPVIAVLSPQNRTYTSSSVPLTITINEPTSWVGYSLDGEANVTIMTAAYYNGIVPFPSMINTSLFGLSDGPHSLTVYANDTSGNMGSSDKVSFTVRLKALLSIGWGWMRIAPREYVYGKAELYKIGDEQIELVVTYEGSEYSRTCNIIYHREYKYGERYLCYSKESGFLIVGLHEHRRWQFWYAVGRGVVAFGFPRCRRPRLMPI